jgi:hypothetical protein
MDILELEDEFYQNAQDYSAFIGRKDIKNNNNAGFPRFRKYSNPKIIRPQEIKVVPPPQQQDNYAPVPQPSVLPISPLPTGKPSLFNEYMENWIKQYPFIKGNIDPRTGEEINLYYVKNMISDAMNTYKKLKSFSKSAMLNKAALKEHIQNLKKFYSSFLTLNQGKPFKNADGDTNNNSFQLINGLNF